MNAATPILRSDALRAIEGRHLTAEPSLMERAGATAADVATQMLPDGGVPLVIAGPGNNGGDALVVARLLKERGYRPLVVFAGTAEKLPADARKALDGWRSAGGEVLDDIPAGTFSLIVDGLFGIGLVRPLTDRYAELVTKINSAGVPVLALDAPSGLDTETGRVLGCAVRATRTVTFIALKPGLLTLDGPDHCGKVSVHTLGLEWREDAGGARMEPALFHEHLRPRARNTHKGSYGSVGVLGGASGMAGAALLAGRAALQLGAGRVYVGMLDRLPVDPVQPELMLRSPEEALSAATVLAAGPGLGDSRQAVELLRTAIASPLPLVIDADGLNIVAAHPVLRKHIAARRASTVMTPHPAEAARLLEETTEHIQADRIASAQTLARWFRADIVLKGCGTVLAGTDGRWAINASGNAGLASAGSGDVLTGMIAALLAQGWPAFMAAAGAVHLHGAAADHLAAQGCGPVGMTAGELIPAARSLLNAWIADAGK